MKRSPNLTEDKVNLIVEIIRGWNGRLTWSALIQAIAGFSHAKYTRQALHKHERIRVAFETYRASSDLLSGASRSVSAAMKTSIDRINRLELENSELRQREALLLEQFVRWAYNAAIRGLTEEYLNQQMPSTNRRGNAVRKVMK